MINKLVIEDNTFNIENPTYSIIGGGLLPIIFGLIIGFSRVRQAGYIKNIVAELLNILKNKSESRDQFSNSICIIIFWILQEEG